MKNNESKNKKVRLLILLYAAALLCWLLLGCVRLGRGAWYAHKGLKMQQTLELSQLQPVGIRPYETEEPGEWYVSSDADPQLILQKDLYLETVTLRMQRQKEGFAAVLYYKTPGQQDYSEQKAVYADEIEPGVFVFDLKGKRVSEMRIDPDSVGGVITRFDGLELNPDKSFVWAFKPSWKGVLLVLILPLFAAALLLEIAGLCKHKQQ